MANEEVLSDILLESGTNEMEVLELYIDEMDESGQTLRRYFGVNVAKVMQVIENRGFAHSEGSSNPCYMGVITLRGHIVTILDLATWLNLDRVPGINDVVIVTEFSKVVTGFLVSGVTEIHRVGWGDVEPPTGYLAEMAPGSIVGIIEREGRFIQLLDLEQVISDLDPSIMAQVEMVPVKAKRPYNAMVVDDSGTIRHMVRENLTRAGFRVKEARNGQDGLNALMALRDKAQASGGAIKEHLDIVISDIEMPLMDGFTMVRQIKEDPVLKELPVMLYSSIITAELRHKGESVGADEQIAKPDLPLMAEKAIGLIERAERAGK